MSGWLNGQPVSALPLADRAIHYGDGHFTTLAIRQGRLLLWPQHRLRLQLAGERLGIGFEDWSGLEQQLQQRAQAMPNSLLKIMLTRGETPRGYYAPSSQPNLLVQQQAWPEPDPSRDQVIRVRLCQWRLSDNPQLAGLKHLNRLDQVMARREWQREFDEGLVRDQAGRVVEAISANLFVLSQGHWLTPPVDRAGVDGIMRQYLLDALPRWGYRVREQELWPEQLQQADELLLTNSLIGIWPVAVFEQQRFDCQQGRQLKSRLETELAWRG